MESAAETVSYRQGAPSRADFFGSSGFRDDLYSITEPEAFARRLVRYITDDARVLSQVAYQYGPRHGLSRGDIERIRKVSRANNYRQNAYFNVGEPDEDDGVDFAASAVPFAAARVRARQAVDVQAQARAKKAAKRRAKAKAMPESGRLLVSELLANIAAHMGMSARELCKSGQDRQHARARFLAIAVLKARGHSWVRIGAMLGGRDHASMIHGARQFFDRDIADPEMARAWEALAPAAFKAVRTREEFQALLSRTGK